MTCIRHRISLAPLPWAARDITLAPLWPTLTPLDRLLDLLEARS